MINLMHDSKDEDWGLNNPLTEAGWSSLSPVMGDCSTVIELYGNYKEGELS